MSHIQHRNRLAALVECAEDAIVGMDPDGTIRAWNPAAERILGATAAEAIGRSLLDFVRPGDAEAWRALLARALAGDKLRAVEMVCSGAEGRPVDVGLTMSAIRDDAGAVVGLGAIVRDIGEVRRLRGQMAVSDRMTTVGVVSAGLAHEINNPLAAVVANLELALRRHETLASPELAAELRDAYDAAMRVRLIVRDLDAFARVKADDRGPVDVVRSLEATVRILMNDIRHRAQLVREYGAVPPVDASEGRLGQVFLNLLLNAAQAIPEGDAQHHEIRVRTWAEHGMVMVMISDTGVGIPPESLPRIFEPFFTTKPIGVGTGLGLPVCQAIVQGYGGEISVRSEPGRGAAFQIALPAGVARRAPTPSQAPAPETVPRRRILVIDDETVLVATMRRILGRHHEVVGCTSGADAIDLLREDAAFDMVFCDVMMPQVTGVDVYAAMQQHQPALAEKVVFMTGGTFTPRTRKFLEGIPNRRIDKPFDVPGILRVVREVTS